MLTLTRRPGDVIVIETPTGLIRVMFIGLNGSNQARIGVDAPREFRISREDHYTEVRDRKDGAP